MHEIEKILDSQPTFEEAFECLAKYSKKPSLLAYISRKQDKQKLLYELERLLKYNPKPNRVYVSKHNFKATPTPTEDPQKSEEFDLSQLGKQHEKIDRNLLPEDMQELYDLNAEDYKILRVQHEKLKQANSDEGRAIFSAEIDRLRTEIRDRWMIIDDYIAKNPLSKSVEQLKKEISTAKSIITKMFNSKKELTSKQLEQLKVAYEKMVNNNVEITPERLAFLQNKGIT